MKKTIIKLLKNLKKLKEILEKFDEQFHEKNIKCDNINTISFIFYYSRVINVDVFHSYLFSCGLLRVVHDDKKETF